ncbi:MAG: cyclic nucleotide-binding domain-containing protein [Rhodospirillaceae bacterium]
MAIKFMNRKTFPANSVIFREGDLGNCAYLLTKGRVEITSFQTGTHVHLTTVMPNQLFGELALIDGAPRSATATVLEPVEVVVVSQADITRQLEGMDPFMRYWFEYLTGRVRDLTGRVTNPPAFGGDNP